MTLYPLAFKDVCIQDVLIFNILFKSDNWAKLIPSVVVARGCVVDKVGEVVDVPFGELRTLNEKIKGFNFLALNPMT